MGAPKGDKERKFFLTKIKAQIVASGMGLRNRRVRVPLYRSELGFCFYGPIKILRFNNADIATKTPECRFLESGIMTNGI